MIRDTEPPVIEITSPEDNATVETRTITVSGTVWDATLYDVKVNGVPAEIDGETFTAPGIVLENEGPNTVTAVARDCVGYSSQHAITVIRDLPVSVTITHVLFSPLSTEELLRVTVFGTVDEPVVYILGKNETYPVYRQGDQTFTNEVVGESAGGTFTIDGLVVFPGINILNVKARDAKERWDEVQVVVEVAAEEGAYGEGQNPEPPYCILSVSVGGEGGEGGGEKLAGGESFMTFENLLTLRGKATLTVKDNTPEINVFVATDLRFTAQASACNAEIATATLDLSQCAGHLAIFKNGNGTDAAMVSKNLGSFKGFWWDVNAKSVGHWKEVCANATLQDVTTGAPISAGPSNKFKGNNDAVKQIIDFKVVDDTKGWILESGTDSYKVLITGKPDAGSTTHNIQVQAKAVTELGLLASQVSWYKKCTEETKFLGTGETFQWTLVAEESTADITAFGNAPNKTKGNGPEGPLENDEVTGYPKPEPQAGESTATIKVDGGFADVEIAPNPFYVGETATAKLVLDKFDPTPGTLPEVDYWDSSDWSIIFIIHGHNHTDTQVTLMGLSAGNSTITCHLKAPTSGSGSSQSQRGSLAAEQLHDGSLAGPRLMAEGERQAEGGIGDGKAPAEKGEVDARPKVQIVSPLGSAGLKPQPDDSFLDDDPKKKERGIIPGPPYRYDWQGVPSGIPGAYALTFRGEIKNEPAGATVLWELDAKCGTLDPNTVKRLTPKHIPPAPASMAPEAGKEYVEGVVTLKLIAAGGDPKNPPLASDRRTVRIYRDHLARDVENFENGNSCDPVHLSRGPLTKLRMSCYGSMTHAGTGSGEQGPWLRIALDPKTKWLTLEDLRKEGLKRGAKLCLGFVEQGQIRRLHYVTVLDGEKLLTYSAEAVGTLAENAEPSLLWGDAFRHETVEAYYDWLKKRWEKSEKDMGHNIMPENRRVAVLQSQ